MNWTLSLYRESTTTYNAACPKRWLHLKHFLQKEVDVGELDHHAFSAFHHAFLVLGREIDQLSDGSITVTQVGKSDIIDTTCPQACKANKGDSPASSDDVHTFRRVLSQMMYIGRTASPTLLYNASALECKTSDFHLRHLKELQSMIFPSLTATPTLSFRSAPLNNRYSRDDDCDTALGIKLIEPHDGRIGFIIFSGCRNIARLLHWGTHKLGRVAFTSATAEFIATVKNLGILLYFETLLNESYHPHSASLDTESKITFELSTTTQEPAEPQNKIGSATIRKAFRPTLLSSVRWCNGSYLAADSLTKGNNAAVYLLSRILRNCIYPLHPSKIERLLENLETFSFSC